MDTTAVTDPTMMGLPVELHDNIAGFANKETNRNMRLVCKKLEPSYTRAFFKEAVFHGEYARVATRLQQFRDFGHSIYVRHAKMILLPVRDDSDDDGDGDSDNDIEYDSDYESAAEDAQYGRDIYDLTEIDDIGRHERPSNMGFTVWDAQLNFRRQKPGSEGPRSPILFIPAISLMKNCTHLQLIIMDDVEDGETLAQSLETEAPWESVSSLRIKADHQMETAILSRMVPNLKELQFHDYLETGYQETVPEGSKDGKLFQIVKDRYPGLKRLHIAVLKQVHSSQEIFPPFKLFERILESFPHLEWLSVDTKLPSGYQFNGQASNRDAIIDRRAAELAAILSGFSDLKRLAVRVHEYDLAHIWPWWKSHPSMDVINRLASQLRNVEVAILGEWPVFYTTRWQPGLQQFIPLGHHSARHIGWPLCIRDDGQKDLDYAYYCIGFDHGVMGLYGDPLEPFLWEHMKGNAIAVLPPRFGWDPYIESASDSSVEEDEN